MKRYFAAFTAVLLILTVFAACAKAYKYGLILLDENGIAHILQTDANGSTVVDENGSMVELYTGNDGVPLTDESGANVTAGLTFAQFVYNGESDTLELPEISMPVPKGWKNTSEVGILLENEKTGATLSVSISKKSLEECDKETRDLLGYSRSDTVTVNYDIVRICGRDGFQYNIVNSENGITTMFFLFDSEDGVLVKCVASTESKDTTAADYVAILNTVSFR